MRDKVEEMNRIKKVASVKLCSHPRFHITGCLADSATAGRPIVVAAVGTFGKSKTNQKLELKLRHEESNTSILKEVICE